MTVIGQVSGTRGSEQMKLHMKLAICAAITAAGMIGPPAAAVAQTPPACTSDDFGRLVADDWRLFSNVGDCTNYVATGGTTSLASGREAGDPGRISVLWVAEVGCADQANALLADRYGPANMSIPVAPNGMGPATHVIGHYSVMPVTTRADWESILTPYLQSECVTMYWTDGVGATQVFYDIGLLPLWWFAASEDD